MINFGSYKIILNKPLTSEISQVPVSDDSNRNYLRYSSISPNPYLSYISHVPVNDDSNRNYLRYSSILLNTYLSHIWTLVTTLAHIITINYFCRLFYLCVTYNKFVLFSAGKF